MPRFAVVLLVALAALLPACAPPPAHPSPRELTAFRDQVLAILASDFPERHFVATDDPRVIALGDARLGLDNLYTKYELAGGGSAALRDVVREHFETTLASLDAALAKPLAWEEAKPRLRPQLMPIEYLNRLSLAHRPFARAVAEGFVIDRDKSYQYVRLDDLARWHVTLDALNEIALANLDLASKGLQVEDGGKGRDRFLVVETGDGYDAARILSPSFRESAARSLGTPFFAALPNRDHLFLWSSRSSPDFQAHTRNVVRQDFTERPYPLSASVFSATASAVTELER